MTTSTPDYLAASGGPEAVFAAARLAALADGEARRRAIVATHTTREQQGCRMGCVPSAYHLPRDGQVYKIGGQMYAHATRRQLPA